MKVLAFAPFNPASCRSGAHRRMIEVLVALRELGAKVELASRDGLPEDPWTEESKEWLRGNSLCCDIHLFSQPRVSLCERVLRRLRHEARARRKGATDDTVADHTTARMRRWFQGVASRFAADRVLINYACFADLVAAPTQRRRLHAVLDAHDFVSLNDKMCIALAEHMPAGPVFSPQVVAECALDLRFYDLPSMTVSTAEFSAIDRFDAALAITEQEATLMRSKTTRARIIAAPTPANPRAAALATGTLALFPMGPHPFNLQGYAWFIRKVLPLMKGRARAFELTVSGALYRRMALAYHPQVRNLGFVAEPSVLWSLGRMLINPVFGGTGQPIKTIEAMAAGLAPIVLERFAEAAPIVHGVNGFVAKDETDFAEYCSALWNDPERCRDMGRLAREAVAVTCSRELFARQLKCALDSDDHPGPKPAA